MFLFEVNEYQCIFIWKCRKDVNRCVKFKKNTEILTEVNCARGMSTIIMLIYIEKNV